MTKSTKIAHFGSISNRYCLLKDLNYKYTEFLQIYRKHIYEKKINSKILSFINKKKIPLYCIINKSDLIKNDKKNFKKL